MMQNQCFGVILAQIFNARHAALLIKGKNGIIVGNQQRKSLSGLVQGIVHIGITQNLYPFRVVFVFFQSFGSGIIVEYLINTVQFVVLTSRQQQRDRQRHEYFYACLFHKACHLVVL